MGTMRQTDTTNWPVKWQDDEPEDWILPTSEQIDYMRRMMLFYHQNQSSVGDIIINYWVRGDIELNRTWNALRFPLYVYRNFCALADTPEDIWNNEFDIDYWMPHLMSFQYR